MLHNENYEAEILEISTDIIIGKTKYKKYPFLTIHDKNFTIILEGEIYNKTSTSIQNELKTLARKLSNDYFSYLQKFIFDSDGDFIVVIFDKVKKHLFVFNDIFGRLPLYYYKSKDSFIISRELKFITHFCQKELSINRYSLAEYLLFGHFFGDKTFYHNLKYLSPGSLLNVNLKRNELSLINLFTFNFQDVDYGNKKIIECSLNLKNLFIESVQSRTYKNNGSEIILSLSGGYDSRSVLAALILTKMQGKAVTYLDPEGLASNDAMGAELLAKKANYDWTLIKTRKLEFNDLLRLIDLKDGLNHIGMSFILIFFDELLKHFGTEISYYTGDIGGFLYPVLQERQFDSYNQLIDYYLNKNCFFSLNDIEKILNIDIQTFKHNFYSLLKEYPEDDLGYKIIHFRYYGQIFKKDIEGEDRNRCFFWTIAPFYSNQFVKYAMSIPFKYKKNMELYLKFLSTLNHEFSLFPRFDVMSSAHLNKNQWIKSFLLGIYQYFPINIKNYLRRNLRSGYKVSLIDKTNCQKVIESFYLSDMLQEIFSEKSVENLKQKRYNYSQFNYLSTIFLYLKRIESQNLENDNIVSKN